MANGRGYRPKVCKVCGARAAAGVEISFRALCRDCAVARMLESNEQIATRDGEGYERWRDGMRESLERL
jgi:hypothetical protein